MYCTSSLPPVEDTIYQFSTFQQLIHFGKSPFATESINAKNWTQSIWNWFFFIAFSADDKIPSRCASFDYNNRRPFWLFAYILPYGVQVVNRLYKKMTHSYWSLILWLILPALHLTIYIGVFFIILMEILTLFCTPKNNIITFRLYFTSLYTHLSELKYTSASFRCVWCHTFTIIQPQ